MDYLEHEKFHEVIEERMNGKPYREIAKAVGVSPATAFRIVAASEMEGNNDTGIPAATLAGLSDTDLDAVLAMNKRERAAWYALQHEAPPPAPPESPADEEVAAQVEMPGSRIPADKIDWNWLLEDPEIQALCAAAGVIHAEVNFGLDGSTPIRTVSAPLYRLASDCLSVYDTNWKASLIEVLKSKIGSGNPETRLFGAQQEEATLRELLNDAILNQGISPEGRLPFLRDLLATATGLPATSSLTDFRAKTQSMKHSVRMGGIE